jgi:hypothetical protein
MEQKAKCSESEHRIINHLHQTFPDGCTVFYLVLAVQKSNDVIETIASINRSSGLIDLRKAW